MGNLTGEKFETWLRNIYGTQEDEISCTECFDLASHFVDQELSGQDVETEFPLFRQHLNQCGTCRDEYEMLRDLSRLEDEGGMPSLDVLQTLIV